MDNNKLRPEKRQSSHSKTLFCKIVLLLQTIKMREIEVSSSYMYIICLLLISVNQCRCGCVCVSSSHIQFERRQRLLRRQAEDRHSLVHSFIVVVLACVCDMLMLTKEGRNSVCNRK